MPLGPYTPVRSRYNNQQRGVVESVVRREEEGRSCMDGSVWVRWEDGTTTQVGETDVVETRDSMQPLGGTGTEGGNR